MDGELERQADPTSNDDDFKIKGAAARRPENGKRKEKVASEVCSICLEPITERAVAVPCNHLTFDFLCLVSWLQEQVACPLCKTAITAVQYDFRSPDDWKTYRVPDLEADRQTGRGRRQPRNRNGNRREDVESQIRLPAVLDAALEGRRNVYRNRLFSFHLGANSISGYRDLTPSDISKSAALQSKAKTFLRRELQVFSFLDARPRGHNRDFLVEYIVAILKSKELKGAGGEAEDLLQEHLGRDNARLLLHELQAWLRSPHTSLATWDENVQYASHAGREDKTSSRACEG